jgi:phosphonate transport system ATP-binding protein
VASNPVAQRAEPDSAGALRAAGSPRPAAARTVLEVRDLRAGYGDREILKGVSFVLGENDFFAIIGPSGAGKSTLIRCVNRLVEPTGGDVIFNGTSLREVPQRGLREVRRNIGMIFQEFNLIERLSVMDNVLAGRLGYTGTIRSLLRMYTRQDIRDALVLLEKVGLGEHLDKRADRLSGGQRQRVGIARALIQNPKLLLVDEPTSSLDPKISREVMGLIREMARERGIPVLCNIHDVELACEFCSRVIGLQDGVKKFEGTPAELDRAALQEIYAMEVL